MEAKEQDEICRAMVMALIGIQTKCPKCGGEFSAKVAASFKSGSRVKCSKCDFYGNWKFGTQLEGSRLNNYQFLSLFFKYSTPNDAPAIAKHLGLDPATVREWREKIVTAANTMRASNV